jgi:endonuclease/exonuclease/phosphatase family metal-dependent hydrolase
MHARALDGRRARRPALLVAAFLALVGALLVGLASGEADAKKKQKAPKIGVMTRNIYLGADLGPILEANNINTAVDAGGEIANQVDRTNFPVRAQALAAEILSKRPDLVGLQEVALWRTGPVNLANVTSPSSTDVEYDFLQLLLSELNKSGNNYEAVVVKQEFDAEFPVNDDTSDGQTGLPGADHNERLTMRDVILRRVDSKAKVSNPNSGTFATLLRVSLGGGLISLDVTRGWTAVDVKLKGTKKFRFVNTHLEAFDSSGQNTTNTGTSLGRGDIRAAQATELVSAGGPADPAPKYPVILLGDINSDDDTVQPNGDRNAYNALLSFGFSERSTNNPLSCCLDNPNLDSPPSAVTDFDHQVDHILTEEKKVKLKDSSVTGLAPAAGGLWPADHAGVHSTLKMPKKGGKKK